MDSEKRATKIPSFIRSAMTSLRLQELFFLDSQVFEKVAQWNVIRSEHLFLSLKQF